MGKPLILHLRACNFYGGPERQILGHIQHSQAFRHRVVSFTETPHQDELTAICRNQGIPVTKITTRSAYDPFAILKLRRLFQTHHPHLICSHGYRPTLLSLPAKTGLALPLVAFSRGRTSENLKVRAFEAFEKKAFYFADAVIMVSKGYASKYGRLHLNGKPIHIVHNAIDTNRLETQQSASKHKRVELGISKDMLVIATAGRLSPEKAQDQLIRAFAHVHKQFPNTMLLIIGDGPERNRLETLAHSRNTGSIRFLGFRKDVDTIMCTLDLFVLPSLTEGLPNVVLEAFAASKPVVATRVGGVPEILEDGISGYLVPPANPSALADAMIKCLSDPDKMKAMGRAGYSRVKSDFTFQAQNAKLENIYKNLIEKTLPSKKTA